MGVLEPLVGLAQVAVGIDVKDAEGFMAFAQRPQQTVGGRVVAADQPHELAGFEPATRLPADVGVHGGTPLVHPTQLAYHRLVGGVTPLLEVFDDAGRIGAQPLRLLLQRIVHVGRGDAAPPLARGQRVVEVELRRGLDDGIGGIGRPCAVGDRYVPRRRDEHQLRLLGLEREAEIGSRIHTDPIGVERFQIHIRNVF